MSQNATPQVLLLHDGELADFRSLLGGLGLAFSERTGELPEEDLRAEWDLVIGSPKQLLELSLPAESGAVRMAVLERDTRTLRSMLQRSGIKLVVRRPVHPAALRLLLLHTLYRGDEKRCKLRVSVGGEVTFRAGLRRRTAILADLSTTGCRILTDQPIDMGREVKLQIPPELSNGGSFTVRAYVVRRARSDVPGMHASGLTFHEPRGRLRNRICETVALHTRGPAVLGAKVDAPRNPSTGTFQVAKSPTPAEVATVPVEPAAPLEPQPEPAPAPDLTEIVVEAPPVEARAVELRIDDGSAESPARRMRGAERRRHPRRAYEQRVVALGVEAACVLLGRDLSTGGMRVEPHPDLSVDDDLSVGLHLRGRDKPIVVEARVARDDGPDGLALEFQGLSPEIEAMLDRMVKFLPVLSVENDEDDPTPLVVSQILDHQPADLR